MTREEAIKIIDCYDIGFYDLSGEKIPADKLADAFDMAIEALSKPNYESDNEVRLAVTDRNKDKVVLWDAFGEVEYYQQTTSHGRLIDADALKETMKNAVVKHICTNTLYNTIMAVIDGSPTVKADRPHGEWVEVEVLPEVYDIEGVKTWGSEMQCDQCGFRHMAIEGHMAQYNFCPNCRADMRKEKE